MGSIVLVLFVVRLCHPEVNRTATSTVGNHAVAATDSVASLANEVKVDEEPERDGAAVEPVENEWLDTMAMCVDSVTITPAPPVLLVPPSFRRQDGTPLRHKIYSVSSYHNCFPDVQDVHYPVAVANGVPPVKDRDEAELHKTELLYVGANPYYEIDPAMRSSIPYLVPKASLLLQDIGRRFLDSLAVKGIPLHTIIVTSVLRTEADVAHLRRINGNASEQSCHRFATTFDISYNRYHTVSPPDEPQRRAVRNDSLKFILSEVLRDMRENGRCYIKYEVKQGCFHITVR